MREIKFRAWAVASHCMFYPNWETHDGILSEIPNTILMQYTGLKDKNGTEIYEKDVLNVCNGSINLIPWMDKLYEVKYQLNKGWNICMFCWDKTGKSVMDSTHWCEVVGNIYKNPELLKDSK